MATVTAPEIALTDSAAARVATIAEKQGKPATLRLSVDGGGCSGFQYKFGFADAIEADDAVVISSFSNSMRPESARRIPEIVISVVDFPAPLAPKSVTISPGLT